MLGGVLIEHEAGIVAATERPLAMPQSNSSIFVSSKLSKRSASSLLTVEKKLSITALEALTGIFRWADAAHGS